MARLVSRHVVGDKGSIAILVEQDHLGPFLRCRLVEQFPLFKGGQGGFEASHRCVTVWPGFDRQRENLPQPLFFKEGSSADLARC
jgi:hypothetical protein